MLDNTLTCNDTDPYVVVEGSHYTVCSAAAAGSITFNVLDSTSFLAFFLDFSHTSYFMPSTIRLIRNTGRTRRRFYYIIKTTPNLVQPHHRIYWTFSSLFFFFFSFFLLPGIPGICTSSTLGLFPNGVPSGTNDPILASKLSTGSIFTFTWSFIVEVQSCWQGTSNHCGRLPVVRTW